MQSMGIQEEDVGPLSQRLAQGMPQAVSMANSATQPGRPINFQANVLPPQQPVPQMSQDEMSMEALKMGPNTPEKMSLYARLRQQQTQQAEELARKTADRAYENQLWEKRYGIKRQDMLDDRTNKLNQPDYGFAPNGTLINQNDPNNLGVNYGKPVVSKPPNQLEMYLQANDPKYTPAGFSDRSYTPSSDLMNKYRQSGRSQTNVNVGGDAYEKERAKMLSGEHTTARENATTAHRQNMMIQAQRSIPLETGWGAQWQAWGAKVLEAFGVASNEAIQFAGNADQFRSVTMNFLLEKLAAQKGPQTEGDAQRALKTLASMDNLQDANMFILDLTESLNQQTIEKANFMDQYDQTKTNLQGYRTAWGQGTEGQKSLFDYPSMGKWAGRNGTLEEVEVPKGSILPPDETGHRYIMKDGAKQYLLP
jgi:hypothetical protein